MVNKFHFDFRNLVVIYLKFAMSCTIGENITLLSQIDKVGHELDEPNKIQITFPTKSDRNFRPKSFSR